jgi:hypothetical protein
MYCQQSANYCEGCLSIVKVKVRLTALLRKSFCAWVKGLFFGEVCAIASAPARGSGWKGFEVCDSSAFCGLEVEDEGAVAVDRGRALRKDLGRWMKLGARKS